MAEEKNIIKSEIETIRREELKDLYLYNLKEVEAATGIKIQMLRLYIKAGSLKATKIGKEYKISKENLEAFIAELTNK